MVSRLLPLLLSACVISSVAIADDEQPLDSSFQEAWQENPTRALKAQSEAVRDEMAESLDAEAVGEDRESMRTALTEVDDESNSDIGKANKIELQIEVAPLVLPGGRSD